MRDVSQYQKVQVMTADGVRLIIMLYDGVIRFNKLARNCIEKGDIKGRSYYVNRSFAIIGELSTSLNMEEGGEVAKNLARLYDFSIDRLSRANVANDVEALDAVTRVITELKGGWESIASEKSHTEDNQQTKVGVSHGA